LPPGVHSYALLPIGYLMGRFGPVRRVALADVVYEDSGASFTAIRTGRRIAAYHGVTLRERCVNRLLKLVEQSQDLGVGEGQKCIKITPATPL